MAYATRQDLEDRFGADEIERLDPAGTDPDRTAVALTDISAEINGYLAPAYALPLPSGASFPILTGIACDLARERLYDEAPHGSVKAAATRAREHLTELRDGDLALVATDGTLPARRNGAGASQAGSDPVFTRERLAGY